MLYFLPALPSLCPDLYSCFLEGSSLLWYPLQEKTAVFYFISISLKKTHNLALYHTFSHFKYLPKSSSFLVLHILSFQISSEFIKGKARTSLSGYIYRHPVVLGTEEIFFVGHIYWDFLLLWNKFSPHIQLHPWNDASLSFFSFCIIVFLESPSNI